MASNEISSRVDMAEDLFPSLERDYDWNRIDFRAYKGVDVCGALSANSKLKSSSIGFQTFDFLWMETKKQKTDPFEMLAQLFLTAKPIIDKGHMPPKFFACYDTETIAIVSCLDSLAVFSANDMNWTETASSPSEKTAAIMKRILDGKLIVFKTRDRKTIKDWVKSNYQAPGHNFP